MNALFRILFTAGALFAVIMLVVGGISYIMSAGGESTGEARSRMTAALWGLLLLAASWLILYTVNPKLLNFDLCPAGLDSAGKCATAGISANGSGSPDDRQQAVSSASDINSQINTCRNQGKKPVVSGGAVVCN